MKFICQPNSGENDDSTEGKNSQQEKRHCDRYLSKWTGDLRLVFASFYFWNSGDPLQMSQRGFFLTLLSQIVQQAPDIIPMISPRRWESLCLFNEDPQEFGESELQGMLDSAIRELCKSTKICLFIDGLDEFEGKQQDLISLIIEIIENPNVKVCVASRPWVEFEDAFNHQPNLLLQDLTYSDRKHFVTENLQRDANYDQLRKREPAYANQLIENIVSKSDGVFLWVNIVVKSLLAGMNNGDRIADLQKRLDALPPELEKLYDKILENLDPFYLEHAAQLFKMVRESRRPPPLLLLFYADEIDLSSAISRPIKAIGNEEVALNLDTMRRRLNSNCRGLLEVSPVSDDYVDHSVQYLHRTVKDYISSERAQRRLKISATSKFNPHQSLCAGHLAYLKSFGENRVENAGLLIQESVDQCFSSAAQLQYESPASAISVLDDLREVGNNLAARIEVSHARILESYDEIITPFSVCRSWYPSSERLFTAARDYFFPFYAQNYKDSPSYFLSLAVHYCVIEYIRAQKFLQTAITSQLLWDAVLSLLICEEPITHLQVMEHLLANGADPNFNLLKDRSRMLGSIWTQINLTIAVDYYEKGEISVKWLDVIKLMVQHGAKGEEQLLRIYDEVVSIKKVDGIQTITKSEKEIWLAKVQIVFRKNFSRLSKVPELNTPLELNLHWTSNLYMNFNFRAKALGVYNRIQEIRRETSTRRTSNLSLAWKMKR